MLNDLSQLVQQALLEQGCDPAAVAGLDDHAGITLEFDALPSLMIGRQGDEVWLWSRIAEYGESLVRHQAPALLAELMRGDDSLAGGHPGLCEHEGWLELRGVLAPASLQDSASLGRALALFFERIGNLVQAVRQ